MALFFAITKADLLFYLFAVFLVKKVLLILGSAGSNCMNGKSTEMAFLNTKRNMQIDMSHIGT